MRSLYHSGTPQKGQRFVVESGHAGCGPLSNAVSRWTRGHADRHPRSRDADELTETPHPRLSSRHTIRDSCKKPRRDRSKARGASRMADPRLYQIGTLTSLLVYGMGWLEFDVTLDRVVLVLATVLATQWIGDRLTGGPAPFGSSARSALISGPSLCLLLRTNRADLAVLAAIVTIGGQFLLRVNGKHVYNPTNGGLVVMLLLTNQVWVSPGQWGAAAFFAALLALAGSLVVHRPAR